jgi:hypothetical protein
MRTYNSFLIRCWLAREPPQEERVVFAVEHIQTGERTKVLSLRAAQDWIEAACRAARAAPCGEAEARAAGEGSRQAGPGEAAER